MAVAAANQVREMPRPDEREDVWFRMNKLGAPIQRGVDAEQALDTIGRFTVETRPLYTVEYVTPDEAKLVEVPERAVFRIGAGQQQRLGTAGPKWTPTQPCDVVEAFRKLGVQPEALMDTGDRLLIGWSEGELDILGDPLALTGCAVVAFGPNMLTTLIKAGKRLWCTNQIYRGVENDGGVGLIHRGNVRENLAQWFIEMYASSRGATDMMRQDYLRMANTSLTRFDLGAIAEALIPDRKVTRRTAQAPGKVNFEQRRAEAREASAEARQAFLSLLAGGGTELTTRATNGTLYGAYHAWTEYVTWVATPQTARGAEGLLLGDGAVALERGYQLFRDLAGGKRPQFHRN